MKKRVQFFSGLQQSPSGKCQDVILTPNVGTTPLDVDLYTPQTGGHIFYRITSNGIGVSPTHSGDNATGATIRIGTNHQIVSTGAGTKVIRAVCYQAGYLDSNITEGVYEPPAP